MKKRVVALFIATVMVMAMTACKAKTEDANTNDTVSQDSIADTDSTATDTVGGTATIANPVTPVDSLEELNEMHKVVLCRPAVMGVTDEFFSSINCGDYQIAQYQFDLNGLKYTFRAASITTDISGVYVSDGTVFENVEGEAVLNSENVWAARWFTVDGQYCLTVLDEEGVVDEDKFSTLVEELKARTLELYGN